MKPAPAEREARALGSSTEEGKEDLPERGSWEDYFSFPDVCYWVWCPIWWCCLFVVYLGEASPKRTQRLRLAPSRTPATDRQELSQSFWGHLSALGLLMLPFCSCLFLSSEVSPKRRLQLSQQSFPRWFLLEVVNTVFDDLLLPVCLSIHLPTSPPNICY